MPEHLSKSMKEEEEDECKVAAKEQSEEVESISYEEILSPEQVDLLNKDFSRLKGK
jgi:hypothetical protein